MNVPVMDSTSLILGLFGVCSLICAAILAYRVFSTPIRRLIDAAHTEDGLENRIFPLVAFVALVGILVKLTIF